MGLEKKDQILGNNESNSVKLKYVKLGYHYLISNAMYLFLVPLIVASAHLSVEDFVHLLNHLKLNLISVTLCTALTVFLATLYFVARPRQVYLLNFACYKPPPAHLCSKETFMDRSRQNGCSQESLEFQRKIMERSGQGQKTYAPKSLLQVPANLTFEEAKKEAEMIMFGAIDQLLAKTKVNVKDIGILVVNCSLFNPTPSLSAMVVNRYKLRGNVLSYSLGGMGCSAGLISIDLAKRLLQVCIKLYPKIGYIFLTFFFFFFLVFNSLARVKE
jgi:3-ketoacyl-CoA synthase